jgi:hypothetical protein
MSTHESLPLSWANVHTATCDDAGNVYLLTSQSESEWTLTSLDRERRLRWTTPAPARWGYMEDSAHIRISAWSEAGVLVLWTRGRSAAHLVACRDGSTAGKLGASGDGYVDLARASSVAVDRDGTLLVVTSGVLRRFSSAGAPMPLWEGSPLSEVALAEPKSAEHAFAFVGWDGATWVATYRAKGTLWGESWDSGLPRWRRYDRRGQTLAWSEPYFLLGESSAAWVDRNGHPYAQWLIGGSFAHLMRYAPDLKTFEYWLASRGGPPLEPGTFDASALRPSRPAPIAIGRENVLSVAPDGAIWAFGSLDHVRCFSPNGTPTFVSAASGATDS